MAQDFQRRLSDGTHLILRTEQMLNNFDTETSGEKVYDTVLIATMFPPGGGNQQVPHEVRRIFGKKERGVRVNKPIMDRLSHHVSDYDKNAEAMVFDGVPVEDVSFIHQSLVGMLKVKNIHTVEMLADIPDSSLGMLGTGGRELRDKAKHYVESRKSSAPIEKMMAENDALKKRIDALEKAKEEAVVEEKTDDEAVAAPRKAGRPKKNDTEAVVEENAA